MKNLANAVFLHLENVKQVSVHFKNSSSMYTYLTTLDVKAGDKAVVHSPKSGDFELVCVHEVKEGLPLDLADVHFEYKLLVDVVNLDRYRVTRNMQNELLVDILKANEAKKEKERAEKLKALRAEFPAADELAKQYNDAEAGELNDLANEEPALNVLLVRL